MSANGATFLSPTALTKSSESSESLSSPSVVLSSLTRASTFSVSRACRSLAMFASRSISSHPGSMEANGSSSSSSSPSQELLEILDMSIKPPSSDPGSLSCVVSSWLLAGPKMSEKSSSSSSANFWISIEERALLIGRSGRTDGLEAVFLRKLVLFGACIDRGKFVRSDGWNSCGVSVERTS